MLLCSTCFCLNSWKKVLGSDGFCVNTTKLVTISSPFELLLKKQSKSPWRFFVVSRAFDPIHIHLCERILKSGIYCLLKNMHYCLELLVKPINDKQIRPAFAIHNSVLQIQKTSGVGTNKLQVCNIVVRHTKSLMNYLHLKVTQNESKLPDSPTRLSPRLSQVCPNSAKLSKNQKLQKLNYIT